MKRPLLFTQFSTAIALSLLSFLASPMLLNAQARSPGALQFKMPSPPSSGIPTGRYRGGASRGDCPATNSELTALVPFIEQSATSDRKARTYVWGQTVSERPTFWFYLPYTSQGTYTPEFVLQDENEEVVYREMIALPAQPGVIGVQLPAAVAPLAIGKLYHWFFKVYCSTEKKGTPISVEGMIQRVQPTSSLHAELATASSRQKVDIFAANGIWYDAITNLADLRYSQPQDAALTTAWADLLRSINLQDVAAAPLLDCCKPKANRAKLP